MGSTGMNMSRLCISGCDTYKSIHLCTRLEKPCMEVTLQYFFSKLVMLILVMMMGCLRLIC